MAMTPRGEKFLTPPRPVVATVGPVYEDFRPMTEWKQDEQSNSLLLIYLSGFQREHLKVSAEGRNILRARGEKLVAGNRWSRFQQDFPLPEDCSVRQIRAKFEGGILTIIIPKKREAEDNPKEAAKATESGYVLQKQQWRKKHQEAADDANKGRDEEARETPPYQKMLSEKPEMNILEKPAEKSKEETDYQKGTQKREEPTYETEDADIEKINEKLISDKPMTMIVPSLVQIDFIRRDRRIMASPIPNNLTRENEGKLKSQKDHGNVQTKEKETTTTSATSSSTDFIAANYKQALKNFMGLNEQRRLLVNVGVAVLVIVALGAYLSNTFQEKLHDI